MPLGAQLGLVVDHALHLDQIHETDEHVAAAHRDLDRQRIGVQALLHHFQHVEEVRAHAIHLVDERDSRDVVTLGLVPHRLGLRLHTTDRAEKRHSAVQHAQRALHLHGEIDVTGRVDDVDAVILPVRADSSGRNGDPALLLLLHPVGRGRAFVDLTNAVHPTGVVQDALGRRRLTGINVRHDADVTDSFERYFSCHKKLHSNVEPFFL